jgi:hypothetical protein
VVNTSIAADARMYVSARARGTENHHADQWMVSAQRHDT